MHYYPFGLTMSGISLKAAGSLENRKKYNGIEYDDDLEIDEYEAFYRNLDPQTGRWWEIDPKCEASINPDMADDDRDATTPESLESISPYASMNDNPALHSDPLGDMPGCCQWSLQILQTTEMLQDQIIIAGGGAADPVTDAAAVVIDVLGLASAGLSALWEWTTEKPATPAPASLVPDKPVVKPIPAKVQAPTAVKQIPSIIKAKSIQQNGGGKNAQHANQKAKDAAQKRYNDVKAKRDALNSKANKTKEDTAELEKLNKQVKHEKQKMDNTGENHSQKAKGSN